MRRRAYPLAAIAAFAATLLSVSPAGALGPRVPDPIPAPIQKGDVTVGLQTLATGFVDPVTAVADPDGDDTLYVVEQRGRIWAVSTEDEGAAPRLFGTVSSLGLNLGCFGINYDERGTFGLAFSPDYKKSGLLYVYQSRPHTGDPNRPANQCNATQPDHDNTVTEYRVTDPGSDDATIDTSTAREILRVPHPQFNHNGGELRFGPDNLLYISIGDGGAADDQGPGHVPGGNAQDRGSLLGKILRIDPRRPSSSLPYTIPASNPFVGQPGARGEIYALGFRNPFKMSFDGRTKKLYVADVGQNDIEEVDVVVKGGNYGWPVKEGTFAFDDNGAANGFVTADVITGYIDPIAQYDHCLGPVPATQPAPCPNLEGVAIVGGFVYRGHEIPDLRGHYVFGDYSTSFFRSAGRLFYLDDGNQVRELNLAGQPNLGTSLLGIGQDADGELYVLGKTGAVPGNTGIVDPTNTTGSVRKLVPVDDGRGRGRG